MIGDRKKRVAIFASFSKNHTVADYVIYYLRALHEVADQIVFVSDNEMEKGETDKLSEWVVTTICYRHEMYDFGSYRIGYSWLLEHHLLEDADELIFANDSCYGPVYPFKQVFGKMDKQDCDFWGLTDSYETEHHLLSFFLVFRRNVFTSVAFHNFVSGFVQQKSFWDYVYLYERRFTGMLEENGFKSAVYIDIDEDTRKSLAIRSGNGNLTLFPVFLHDLGMPLVKIKAMNGTFGLDLHESPQLLLQKIKDVNPDMYHIITADLHDNGIKQEDKWCTPEEIVSGAKVVSFDIFDTLLARPYIKPTDLFLHIEEATGAIEFKERRIAAERKARKVHKEQADVTFDQIYKELDERFSHLKQEELRYERRVLYPKTDARKIYDEAVRQGKVIIAVSDMYLPQEFLESVLKEKGYDKISRVFVSNQEDCCKGDGRLFRKVLDTLGIEPAEMVHIGDNYDADKRAPEALGIRAYHRPTNIQQMLDNPSMGKYKHFAKKNPCLATSVLTGIYARHNAQAPLQSAFSEFGYHLGGPFAIGYCQYIHNMAKQRGNDAILFVSRDGYALHKVYQKMYPNDIPSYYIYASRKLVLRNDVHYKDESYLKNVCEIYTKECLENTAVTPANLEVHREKMEQWAEANAAHYKKYIDSLHITGKKIMSVDMTTRGYTSLNMLHYVFGDRIDCGIFSISYGSPCDYETFTYADKVWRVDDTQTLIMQEELITAPERSALRFDNTGHLVFATHNPVEDYRVSKYKEILEGIECFVDDYIQYIGIEKPGLTYELWECLFSSYIKCSHFGDWELLKSIYHDDIGQHAYDNLYNICIKKEAPQNTDNINLFRKNLKHLKAIRKLVIVLCVETAVVIGLIATLILS